MFWSKNCVNGSIKRKIYKKETNQIIFLLRTKHVCEKQGTRGNPIVIF